MATLVLTALLAPSLVVTVSLTVRWFGLQIGGIVGGIPVVGGPVLLAFALTEGPGFTSTAAVATLSGITAIALFLLTYWWLAHRLPWQSCLPVGWVVYAATAAGLSLGQLGSYAALALTLATIAITATAIPRSVVVAGAPPSYPRWDLPLRGASAFVLVLALAAAASVVGPTMGGLLASFPILASVLLLFTHAQQGSDHIPPLVRGLAIGLPTFATFCFTVAMALPEVGTGLAFSLGVAAVLAVQIVTALYLAPQRRPRAERN